MEHWRTIRGDNHAFHFRPAEFEVLVSYPRPILEMHITKLKGKAGWSYTFKSHKCGISGKSHKWWQNHSYK